jgi:hypothetical protein
VGGPVFQGRDFGDINISVQMPAEAVAYYRRMEARSGAEERRRRKLAKAYEREKRGSSEVGVPLHGRRDLLRWAVPSAVLLIAGGVTGGLFVDQQKDGAHAAADEALPERTPSDGKDSSPTWIDAVMPVPDDPNLETPSEHWLFAGDRYFRVRSSSTSPVDKLLTNPSSLADWNTIGHLQDFEEGIDTVLRVPGSENEYWVFAGEKYIRIRLSSDAPHADALLFGPAEITDWDTAFYGLPDNGIDAIMPVPDDQDQFWIFSGRFYVRTQLLHGKPGGAVKTRVAGFDWWSGTLNKEPGFKRGINSVMPVTGDLHGYWVFSGTQYMKIHLDEGTYTDTVTQPPRTIHI